MIRIYFILFCTTGLLAQVGINTTAPTASLDINGDLRVRSVSEETNLSLAKNYILLTNNGLVKRVSLKEVHNETFKTMLKGNFSSNHLINVSLLSGPEIIPFDQVEFDLNNEFDINTHTFTAKEAGIYEIQCFIKTDGIIVGSNYGLRLLKNNVVIQENSYTNMSAAFVEVTPPIRNVISLVKLDADDTVTFELASSIAAVSVLENSKESSYFLIKRVR